MIVTGVRTYDPLHVQTATLGGRGKSHRIRRGARETLCGIPAVTLQATLDSDATCGWCILILEALAAERAAARAR